MQQLPDALAPMAAYRQFLLFRLVWDAERKKHQKIPINPHTFQAYPRGSDWQKDPASTTDAATAIAMANAAGEMYGVGFLITPNDPFFFVDLDNCLNADNTTWSPLALTILGMLPGAAVEVSQSGRGLHVFGTGRAPAHGSRNDPLGLEFYTEWRFAALTGTNAIGSAGTDLTAHLPALVSTYFPERNRGVAQEWSSEPVPEWNGPEDDDELIEKALASQSAGGIFGGRSSFAGLWEADDDMLSKAYPDPSRSDGGTYGRNEADAALAQHLAFWTGNDCDRMLRLMRRSALVRDKWDREDYLERTILRAVALQESFYNAGGTVDDSIAESHGAPKLRASSEAQGSFATNVRAEKLQQATEGEARALCASSGPSASAKFWLDNQDKTPAQLAAMVAKIDHAAPPMGEIESGPQIVSGHQYLGATLQLEHFKGCVYIQSLHKVLTPSGWTLKSEQFNATYGGYVFQLDETGDKTTRRAWEAFTESQVIRWPKAESTCFRPELPPGEIIRDEDGVSLVNIYVPVNTPRVKGDPSPFLAHLEKLVPVQSDREIILSYMAACIQHKGVKFQWAPLIQGAEGNGKTLLTRCVAFAIGRRYTHLPPANEISEKFNDWLFYKLFIGIEDVYVPDNKREVFEVLKPMITNDRLAMRAMQAGQVMGDNRANFILNSNHKDGVRKTRSDRRFAPFFTAQQQEEDLVRDGMTGDYFPSLYRWLKGEGEFAVHGENYGYSVVADYLADYHIPAELNPAGLCHRAPRTSSTEDAVAAGMGSIEQEILEAIEEGRVGFAGGWISSVAVERLLDGMRAARAIPPNKRRDLLRSIGYDWHPALTNGRVNNAIQIDEGKKPRLFIRHGHIHANLTTSAEVARAYQEAQGAGGNSAGQAAAVFAPQS